MRNTSTRQQKANGMVIKVVAKGGIKTLRRDIYTTKSSLGGLLLL